jgi:hypothetical protein
VARGSLRQREAPVDVVTVCALVRLPAGGGRDGAEHANRAEADMLSLGCLGGEQLLAARPPQETVLVRAPGLDVDGRRRGS